MSKITDFIKKFTFKDFDFKPNGYNNAGQWKAIRSGDVVEYAVQESAFQYKVEEILDGGLARIRKIEHDGSHGKEAYPAPLQMLRPLAK